MSSHRSGPWCPLLVALAALLSACSDQPTAPAAAPKPNLATDAYCAMYPDICSPSTPDPEPPAIGYYGGGVITDTYCAGLSGGINDADQDQLADDCEQWLALRFAPKMLYDRADDVRRESYWAVKPIKPGLVRVFYALAYYVDLGPPADCIIISDCNGHSGDSEWVILDLKYNRTSQHWYMSGGRLSAHTYVYPLTPGPQGYVSWLTYPDRIAGYPLIFVARQKHANYPTRQICNDGATIFGFDDCSPNDQSFRPEVLTGRNLGNDAHRLVNKVASTYSFYQNPIRYENMWSSSKFFGWQLDHTTSATGYGPILRGEGF